MTFKFSLGLMALMALVGCSRQDPTLEGLRETLDGSAAQQDAARFVAEGAVAFAAPKQVKNASWTHQGGNPQHNAGHLVLNTNITQIWASSVGSGDDRRHQITASPVVSNGRVFTLDSRATVTATSTTGQPIWSMDLTNALDSPDDASGGGLAVAKGRVFVTTGFGTVSALDVETGALIWTQDLVGFGGAAPTIYKDLLYIASRDGSGWAINVNDGTIAWQIAGPEGLATLTGGPGVAVSNKWAIFPFGSGEVYSTFRRGGLRNWTSVLSGARLGQAITSIGDLTGDPVIAGNRVYLSNASGRTAALDLQSGDRVWTANQGTKGDIWVAGNSVFAVSDLNHLMRLDANDGELVWSVPLPRYTTDKVRRRKTVVAHFGPILAGGRLVVMSSDGIMRQYDPNDGSQISETEMARPAASAPIVADGTLYVMDTSGNLVAFR
ncbi:MAG: PQQ-binding-like beta-propeller repeat protein [Planktomarina sp.]